MPLPTPDYLTNERYQWNGNTRVSALLETFVGGGSPAVVGTRTSLYWGGTDVYQRERFHNLIMSYANHNGITEAAALTSGFPSEGWQEVDFGGTVVGGNASGLAARVYTASVVIDGNTTVNLSVDGTTATTFTLVVAAINAAVAAGSPTTGTAQINAAGNIEILSSTTGTSSSIAITDVDLFASLAGYVSMGSQYIGVTTPLDILQVNELSGINNDRPIVEQFNGLIHEIPVKPSYHMMNVVNNTIYNDNADGIWKYWYSDVAV